MFGCVEFLLQQQRIRQDYEWRRRKAEVEQARAEHQDDQIRAYRRAGSIEGECEVISEQKAIEHEQGNSY